MCVNLASVYTEEKPIEAQKHKKEQQKRVSTNREENVNLVSVQR